MGEIVLTFAVEKILERAGSMAIQEFTGARQLKNDLQKLRDFTQSILGDVQKAQNNEAEKRPALKPLLVKLEDVLYSAEDVLDDFSYEILRRQIEYHSQPWLRIRGFVTRNNPILFRLKMARRVKKINQSLDDIKKQALDELALTGRAIADRGVVSTGQLNRETVSFFDNLSPPVTGRASEVEAIINILEGSTSTPSPLTIVSIVGFGGLGKTTLAKMVLKEVKNRKLFDETLWVCVSDPFDDKKILKGMLETLDEHAGSLDTVEAILQTLGRKLTDKRFFLVLDDVWEQESEKCMSLRRYLSTICNRDGNFVIVTTRNSEVAKAMDTKKGHEFLLKGLNYKECWDIIRKKCLLHWGGSFPEDLEEIGLDVAKKCKGVPLAAEVVAGTLCQKRNREAWSSIKDSDAWEQIDEGNKIFPVLMLSFHHLDPSLKQCFIYCSVFPKDFMYDKEKLIELWMAEGFLQALPTNRVASVKSMEDIGDECFNGLIVHSFLQDAEWGSKRSFKMHDLLHDLAMSVSNYKRLSLKDEPVWIVSRTSNHRHALSEEELKMSGARNVRRCVILEVVDDVSSILSKFKSLRSLDISGAGLKELPSVIRRLKHLRFLDISKNEDIKEFPKVITKLYNLQTLYIIGCSGINMLPTDMVNLKRLRHFYLDYPSLKIYKVGVFTELRTLPYFKVCSEEGFRIGELQKLKELSGELQIVGLWNVRDKEEAEGANLKEKKLIGLSLEWDLDCNSNDENVLEGLLPPPCIERLRIWGYGGVKFPNWMSMGANNSQCQLSQVVELTLSDCMKCKMMPSLGHLPCLKILTVRRLNDIRCIDSDFYGECKREERLFPVLKEFFLEEMMSLEEWVAAIANEGGEERSLKVFPLLEKLYIKNCPCLRSIWVAAIANEGGEERSLKVFPLLEKLYIKNCPRLRSIPFRHLSSLLEFRMQRCDDMEYFSNENLTSLNHLNIDDCRNLVFLSSMKGLISLEYLLIQNCPKLTSVPHWIKDCTSLRELIIWECEGLISIDDDIIGSLSQLKGLSLGPFSEELEDFPGLNSIHHLSPSIIRLSLHGWKKLKSLPCLQSLNGLLRLSITDFKGLEALPDWLGNLSSLRVLEFYWCDNLKNLSPTIKRLSNLRYLLCFECPLLAQRYKDNTGPDSYDISHIPNTYFS